MSESAAVALVRIVGVRFKRAGKIYYFDPGVLDLVRGDRVLVETAAGVEFGEVVVPPKMVPESDVVPPIRPVLRRVEREDYDRLLANRHDARLAHEAALERIAARGLPMRLVSTEYTFDRNRLTFFFTAESRVDFRQLVRDLARQFGVRIELRQIGVRDEAKEVGGIGLCGRELCCSSWMGEFEPVSIRMAKEQKLSLNPSKLTGQCGRLKCCLKFENDTYRRIRSELPDVGDLVQTTVAGEKVTAPVAEVLVARESVELDLGEGRKALVSLGQIESGEAKVLTGKLADGAREHAAAADGEGDLRPGAGRIPVLTEDDEAGPALRDDQAHPAAAPWAEDEPEADSARADEGEAEPAGPAETEPAPGEGGEEGPGGRSKRRRGGRPHAAGKPKGRAPRDRQAEGADEAGEPGAEAQAKRRRKRRPKRRPRPGQSGPSGPPAPAAE